MLKVVQAIGAAEDNVLDFGAPKRIDGSAAISLIEAAVQTGVDQYVMISSLGTGKFGWPAGEISSSHFCLLMDSFCQSLSASQVKLNQEISYGDYGSFDPHTFTLPQCLCLLGYVITCHIHICAQTLFSQSIFKIQKQDKSCLCRCAQLVWGHSASEEEG